MSQVAKGRLIDCQMSLFPYTLNFPRSFSYFLLKGQPSGHRTPNTLSFAGGKVSRGTPEYRDPLRTLFSLLLDVVMEHTSSFWYTVVELVIIFFTTAKVYSHVHIYTPHPRPRVTL